MDLPPARGSIRTGTSWMRNPARCAMVTTALFLLGFVVVLLMCLQFSLVVSAHRRQIKRLAQQVALLQRQAATGETPAAPQPGPS